jgi:hypothetical protein
MASVVRMNNEAITFVLFKENGLVGLDLQKRARRMAHYSRKDAPVGAAREGRKPGKLKRSIRVSGHKTLPRVGQTIRVGTFNVPYAVFVHEGTKRHKIRAKKARALAFPPSVVSMGKGLKIVRREVNHPGNKPNQFLKKNIKWLYR